MVTNPVLVFVDRDKALALNAMPGLRLPIGWTGEGKMLVGGEISGESCSVLWLDDRLAVPDCEHRNKDAQQRLLVIAHINSVLHANPKEDHRLASWGRPVVLERFSHLPHNQTWRALVELFSDGRRAKTFADSRQTTEDVTVLEDIAALCQLALLAPRSVDEEFSEYLATTVRKLRVQHVMVINNKRTFEEKIEVVRKLALTLRP